MTRDVCIKLSGMDTLAKGATPAKVFCLPCPLRSSLKGKWFFPFWVVACYTEKQTGCHESCIPLNKRSQICQEYPFTVNFYFDVTFDAILALLTDIKCWMPMARRASLDQWIGALTLNLLSLSKLGVLKLIDHPDLTLAVYCGHWTIPKTTGHFFSTRF